MELSQKELVEKLQKYIQMTPLKPDSFGLDKLESVLIWNPKLKQYSLWGLDVYKKYSGDEKLIINKYQYFLNYYNSLCEKKDDFEIIEKIRDRVVGAKLSDGLLIMCSLKPWEDQSIIKPSLKTLENIIQSDYYNIFLP
jgi:hypothetical protein